MLQLLKLFEGMFFHIYKYKQNWNQTKDYYNKKMLLKQYTQMFLSYLLDNIILECRSFYDMRWEDVYRRHF